MSNTKRQAGTKQPFNRRRFLKFAGFTGAGLVVVAVGGVAVGLPYIRSQFSNTPKLTDDPTAWLAIQPNGQVLLSVNKMEMGQGVGTAAAQIVAEELDVPFAQVVLAPVDTTNMPPDTLGTAGSLSVIQLYAALRTASATARQALLELAAERSGQPVAQLQTRDGFVVSGQNADVRFGYGELVAGRTLVRQSDTAITFKTPAEYRVVGTSVPRRDLPDKVNGKGVYGYDPQPAGLLIGRVIRPPVFGAKLASVDLGPARGLPGVVALVHDGDFVGVAAESAAQADAAVAAVRVDWTLPERPLQQADVEALLLFERDPTMLQQVGDVATALANAATPVEAQYRTGFLAHAPIEPMVGVADVRADRATVWAPTQSPFGLRRNIAGAIGLNQEQVTVVPTLIGGGFGRKALSEAAVEAARLSKAAGRPVRVGWSRREDFQHGFVGPLTVSDFRAALDASGQITAWDQHKASGEVLFGFFPSFLQFAAGHDFGAARGVVGPYTIPHTRIGLTTKTLPVRTGSWRGLGLLPAVFAVEQFMDELAGVANADPLAFRLRHLPDDEAGQRMRRVLERAAQQAGWGTPLPVDHGRGIACSTDAGTFVAEVAEVRVDRSTGMVQVIRVTAAVDCGLAVSPDGVIAQTEGCIVMGLSAALKEEVTVVDGEWSARDLKTYAVARIGDTPEIVVTLVGDQNTPPSGMGEPPIGPVAAAVGNAIAAATGVRVRTMPMTPARVLAALQAAG